MSSDLNNGKDKNSTNTSETAEIFFTDTDQPEDHTENKNVFVGMGVLGGIILIIGFAGMMTDKIDPLKEAQAKDVKIRNQVSELISEDKPSSSEFNDLKDKRKGMVYIPAGAMLTGNLNQEIQQEMASAFDKRPSIKKLKGFYIDKYEYPNATTKSDGSEVVPVTGVSYFRAKNACKKMGKRLCTSLEWEKACRGSESLIFSYGDSFDATKCTLDGNYKLGKDPDCKNTNGVYGMSGGPREWTSSNTKESTSRKIVKGGPPVSVSASPEEYRCGFDGSESRLYIADDRLSFRCCLSVDAPELPDIIPAELRVATDEDTGSPE